jgi:RNA polymerase sigma-70 factor (ECF subfamily)
VKALPTFNYDPKQGFRRWLRTVLMNRWRDHCRQGAATLQQADQRTLAEQAASNFRDLEDEEYRQQLAARAMQVMQAEFQPSTWKACWEHLISGRPALEVGKELGLSEAAVYAAKYRVLKRLREELDGLLD